MLKYESQYDSLAKGRKGQKAQYTLANDYEDVYVRPLPDAEDFREEVSNLKFHFK